MPELDERLKVLRATVREWAGEMACHSLDIEKDPTLVSQLVGLPVFARLARLQIPPRFNPRPLCIEGERFYLVKAAEQVVHLEECACVDLAMTLAAPGAPMAGAMVAILGDEQQQEDFFGRLVDRPTWTFFALTEPRGGSDAGGLTTGLRMDADGLRLSGSKRYVTNAVRAEVGVVFARTGRSPLSVTAVLVHTDQPGYSATPIETLGLRAAQLGAIDLSDVAIDERQVLGRHLPPGRRGLLGCVQALNRLRPMVAAMGVGVARAACEYVRAHRRTLSRPEDAELDRLERTVEGTRRLVRHAAAAVDHDPDRGEFASAAKMRAAGLAEEATMAALSFFGPAARLEHPRLDKLARDARGLEYMEGTGNAQRLNLFGALARTEAERGRAR